MAAKRIHHCPCGMYDVDNGIMQDVDHREYNLRQHTTCLRQSNAHVQARGCTLVEASLEKVSKELLARQGNQ